MRPEKAPTKRSALFFLLALWVWSPVLGVTYYVSNDTGNDADDGLTPTDAFQTLAHVNTLTLQPGDEVRLLCGETWRADPLVITQSGSSGQPIVFGSHPQDCVDKPVLLGTRPISGWGVHQGNIYVADLDDGDNAGLFTMGINQLFDSQGRLPLGRWPNLDDPDGGWSTIDSQPSATRLSDGDLPSGDWTGAVAHVKGIRWYILNREVTASPGTNLDVSADVQCWGGCQGWGYFLQDHLLALDQDGEWHYEPASNRVYVVSSTGAPADGALEGSVVLPTNGDFHGAVILGRNLQEHITWVNLEDLRIARWFDAGVSTPINLERDENQELVIQDLEIEDVAGTGLRLRTWVWDAANNGSGPNGWRGGRNLLVRRNVIQGPNHFGLDSYATFSTFEDNEIRDVGLVANFVREGMGCGYSGTNCTENGAGIRLNHDAGSPDHTSRELTLRRNRLDRIGMNGIDAFGRSIALENNVIDRACWSKGDCGAIRTFGRDNLASSPVRDVSIQGNIIRDVLGNTDGCRDDFDSLFGFGIYLDNYSDNITVDGNTVHASSIVGLLYQRSTGTARNNVFYDNSDRSPWGAQVRLVGSETRVTFEDNVMASLGDERWTLSMEELALLDASNRNVFLSPWRDNQIWVQSIAGSGHDLASWQSTSGFDGASSAHWYTLTDEDPPRSTLVVNDADTVQFIDPGPGPWLDTAQQPVTTPVELQPFTSQVLVREPASIFADGFESGDTSAW